MKFILNIIKNLTINKFLCRLCLIAIITFYISNHWVQVILIQGQSMYPTYKNMQLLLLNKRKDAIGIGDVVAFYSDESKCVLVKRVVAVPNDIVQIKYKTLYVNGVAESVDSIENPGIAQKPISLSDDEFFMLGDNWSVSKDSRYEEIGCVKDINIIGKICPQKVSTLYIRGEIK